MTKIIWEIPLTTVSEANCSEHWTKSSRRHRQQQFFVRQLFNGLEYPLNLPCNVKMIRLGPRYLDAEENLPMAFKWIKDEVSACLVPEKRLTYVDRKGKVKELKGRADDDKRILWEYDQEKSKIKGIRIEISSLDDRPNDIARE